MPANGNQGRSVSNPQTRRRFIQATAALGVAGLAGCGQNDTDPTQTDEPVQTGIGAGTGTSSTDTETETETETEAMGEIIDPVVDISGQLAGEPTDLNYNPFSQSFESTSNLIAYEKIAHFDLKEFLETGNITFIPRGAGSWDIPEGPSEGDTITITANDDRTWHDGDPITGDDLYTTYKLHGYFGAEYVNMVDFDSIEVVDDESIQMALSTKANANLLKQRVLGQAYGFRFNAKHSIFGEYLERIEGAAEEGEEALNEAQQELVEFELDEPVGTGWAKYVDRTPEKVVYEPYEDHPIGSQMEFDTWQNFYAGTQDEWQLALSDRVDVAGGGPKNIMDRATGGGTLSAFRHHFLSAQAIQFNQAVEPYDDPRIRKAFAWAINMDKAINPIKVEGPWGQQRWVVEKPSGLMVSRDAWLGDLDDSFASYDPRAQNMDKVVELMQDAGFERSVNGKWAMDGELLTVDLKHYDWSYIVTYVQGVKEDLEDADFAVETSSPSTMTTDIASGDYEVCTGFWGQSWHPATSHDVMTPNAGWQVLNPPETLEVPPVGEPDSSQTITINAWEEYSKMETASSFEEEQEAVQNLAWAWNHTLPQIEVFNGTAMLLVDTENFRFQGGIDEWDAKLLDGQFEMFNRGAYRIRREEA